MPCYRGNHGGNRRFKSFEGFHKAYEELLFNELVPWSTESSKSVAVHNKQHPNKTLNEKA